MYGHQISFISFRTVNMRPFRWHHSGFLMCANFTESAPWPIQSIRRNVGGKCYAIACNLLLWPSSGGHSHWKWWIQMPWGLPPFPSPVVACVHLFSPVFTDFHLFSPIFTRFHQFSPVFTHYQPFSPVFFCPHPCSPIL